MNTVTYHQWYVGRRRGHTYKISERETHRGTKKYEEIIDEHHLERQDQEWSSKIKYASEGTSSKKYRTWKVSGQDILLE